MNKLLLTGLAISWRVDYDENGVAIGKHVAIHIAAEEAAPFGKRLGANLMLTETMLEHIKVNKAPWYQWIDVECQHIVKGFALKAAQENIEMSPLDFITPLRTQLDIDMKKFCENGMPWYHTFYLIKTIKPGETWLNEDGTPHRQVTEPEVVIIKAD